MRISALADRTGVAVATLKYYLREGLLHPGTPTSRTQAVYDDEHVERVLLVRALIGSAGLSLAAVREVLAVLDDPPGSRHDLLGTTQRALLREETGAGDGTGATPAGEDDDDPWTEQALALVAAQGWFRDPILVRRLANQLRAASAAGVACVDEQLVALAEAADLIATSDLRTVPEDAAGAARQVVVGTLLTDPVILTLRRFAQQHASGGAAASGRAGASR
ncbi:MerR family transcriptional regulator [Isoptericola sp. NPDC057653]|uniref:MerR family transcriptional regulator n=1 Tax=Isoptericola sp. NPDC057653 TaxID=3346195 RepID=UPI003683EA22